MKPMTMVVGQLVPPGTKSKEVSNKQHQTAVVMLIGWLQRRHLAYGSIAIDAEKVGVTCYMISRLWGQVGAACVHGLIVSPEMNSQKSSR